MCPADLSLAELIETAILLSEFQFQRRHVETVVTGIRGSHLIHSVRVTKSDRFTKSVLSPVLLYTGPPSCDPHLRVTLVIFTVKSDTKNDS